MHFSTFFTPLKLQRLAFLIKDQYKHNGTDNYKMRPTDEGPIKLARVALSSGEKSNSKIKVKNYFWISAY